MAKKHRKRRLVTVVNYAAKNTLKTSIPAEIVRNKGIEVRDRLHWEEDGVWVKFQVFKVREVPAAEARG